MIGALGTVTKRLVKGLFNGLVSTHSREYSQHILNPRTGWVVILIWYRFQHDSLGREKNMWPPIHINPNPIYQQLRGKEIDSFLSQQREVKSKQPRPSFEFGSPIPVLTTITFTLSPPPFDNAYWNICSVQQEVIPASLDSCLSQTHWLKWTLPQSRFFCPVVCCQVNSTSSFIVNTYQIKMFEGTWKNKK